MRIPRQSVARAHRNLDTHALARARTHTHAHVAGCARAFASESGSEHSSLPRVLVSSCPHPALTSASTRCRRTTQTSALSCSSSLLAQRAAQDTAGPAWVGQFSFLVPRATKKPERSLKHLVTRGATCCRWQVPGQLHAAAGPAQAPGVLYARRGCDPAACLPHHGRTPRANCKACPCVRGGRVHWQARAHADRPLPPIANSQYRESLLHPLCLNRTSSVTCKTHDARHVARPLLISEWINR